MEIASEGRQVSKRRGFLAIDADRLPIDDIDGLILSTPAVTVSGAALLALAEQGTPVVIADGNRRAAAVLVPLGRHSQAAGRVALQAGASTTLKDDLWATVVRAKLDAQAAVLRDAGRRHGRLLSLARRVMPGDPTNVEAQGARHYWKMLMGRTFRRQGQSAMPNPALNYGYAILRAAMSRALAVHGLHPALGIHHAAAGNPLCLADDLMEPYRPVIDRLVVLERKDAFEGKDDLDANGKQVLAGVLARPVVIAGAHHTVASAIRASAMSLLQSFEGKRSSLAFPTWAGGDGAEPVSPDVDDGLL